MSLATLLTGGSAQNPAFGFEHAANHQVCGYYLAQGANAVVQPFWFDPRTALAGQPASLWQISHQLSHNDMSALLPLPDGSMSYGQTMVDENLNTSNGLTWSLFVNMYWHLAAMSELGPLVS